MSSHVIIPLVLAVSLAAVACATPPAKSRTVRYPNGKPKWEYTAVRGIPNGPSVTWHANGKKQSAGSYRNGKKIGVFRYYGPSGEFERQVYYHEGIQVWSSTDANERPPDDLVAGLLKLEPDDETRGDFDAWFRAGRGPERYFASLDRTTAPPRVGLAVGWGVASADESPRVETVRTEVFGNYRFGPYGAYAQAATSSLEPEDGRTLSGKRTFELGGMRHLSLSKLGSLTTRLGLLLPIAGNDVEGVVVAAESAYTRTDAAAAGFSSATAVRTSTSLSDVRGHIVFQADAGIDWVLGGSGDQSPIGALARLNGGVGAGLGRFMVTAEVANAVLLNDTSRAIRSLSLSSTVFIGGFTLTAGWSMASESHTSFTSSAAYGF